MSSFGRVREPHAKCVKIPRALVECACDSLAFPQKMLVALVVLKRF